MKKIMVLAVVVVIVAAFAMPASALENVFGGYWRTRAVTQQNFTGEDNSKAWDDSFVDSRTRLFYTAKINEDLKLVNKFEINAAWGNAYGGYIGTDGRTIFRVKNTYADFTLAPVNFKVGLQDAFIGGGAFGPDGARNSAKVGSIGSALGGGFLFADDFAGATVTFKGEGFGIPFFWIKTYEGGRGKDANKGDVDYFALAPYFSLGGIATINPYFMWGTTDKASVSALMLHAPYLNSSSPDTKTYGTATLASFDKVNVYYLGVDVDAKFDMSRVWFTGIYQGGKGDLTTPTATVSSVDFQAYLTAIGGKVDMGVADVHGQFFYASGADKDDSPDKLKAFFVPSPNDSSGQSYYWAEIMGYGIFDSAANVGESGMGPYNTSAHSCGDKISNIMAGNIGATVKPVPDVPLSITLDAWYAKLAKPILMADKTEQDYLGTEVDLVITYELVKGLKMDIVGAYLFAGNATYSGNNQANPYEIGTRLSLSF
jgi:hypothetical protein